MRDLYKHLKISPFCSEAEIRVAINNSSMSKLKNDATEILLYPDRRKLYDNLHGLLSILGSLRKKMGITYSTKTFEPDFQDFNSPRENKYEQLLEKLGKKVELKTYSQNPELDKAKNNIKSGSIALVFIALIIFGAILLDNNSGRNETPFTLEEVRESKVHKAVNDYIQNSKKQKEAIAKLGQPLDFKGRCQVQEILKYMCLYHGKIDGIIDTGSKKAIKDLIEKEGLQVKSNIDTNLLHFLRKNYLNNTSLCSHDRQPENGHVFISSGENIAPLQIRIPNYGKGFFVKLVNPNTNQSVKEFYVRSGQTVETKVPLGTFQLKYATGKIWIGKYNLFGLDTVYSKANKEFSFYQIGEQVNGYTVELILQPGGNLRTFKIDPEDF